jgi:hypothetical protein
MQIPLKPWIRSPQLVLHYIVGDSLTLLSYAENLFLLTWMQVSESTISRF